MHVYMCKKYLLIIIVLYGIYVLLFQQSFNESFNDCPSTRFEMLIYVTDFLQKHNISYFITYGTLLGAVREQDIITYTPDIDICVPHLEAAFVRSKFHELKSCWEFTLSKKVFHMYSKANMVETVWNPKWSKPTRWLTPRTTYVDIYNMYSIGENKFRMDLDFNSYYSFDEIYPLKKLYIRNRPFWAPKRPELLLSGNYLDWKTPSGRFNAGKKRRATSTRKLLRLENTVR